MSWFNRNKNAAPTAAPTTYVAPAPAPGTYKMLPNTSIEEYRGGYKGGIVSANPGCNTCKGDGFVPEPTATHGVVLCHCRCEEMEQLRVRSQQTVAKPA